MKKNNFCNIDLSARKADDASPSLKTKRLLLPHWKKEYGLWAVEIPKLAPFIGFVGLHYPDFQAHFTPCIEIGWGKGYSYEAASKALEYAFNILHLKEIVSFAPTDNNRSRKLMERLGMIHDLKGDFAHPKLPKDHPLSLHVLYRKQNSQRNK